MCLGVSNIKLFVGMENPGQAGRQGVDESSSPG